MVTMTEKLAETIKKLYKVDFGTKEIEQLYMGKSLGEVLGITKNQMDQFEKLGYDKLDQGKYQDAYDIFVFLMSLQPEITRFYVNAGHALNGMKQYANAVHVFHQSMQLDVDYVPAYLGAALSYWMDGDIESANDTLTSGLIIAVDNDDEESIKEINSLYIDINGGDNE